MLIPPLHKLSHMTQSVNVLMIVLHFPPHLKVEKKKIHIMCSVMSQINKPTFTLDFYIVQNIFICPSELNFSLLIVRRLLCRLAYLVNNSKHLKPI